jgi:hypothetical protein
MSLKSRSTWLSSSPRELSTILHAAADEHAVNAELIEDDEGDWNDDDAPWFRACVSALNDWRAQIDSGTLSILSDATITDPDSLRSVLQLALGDAVSHGEWFVVRNLADMLVRLERALG